MFSHSVYGSIYVRIYSSRDTHENYMTLDIHNAIKNGKCDIMQNTYNVLKFFWHNSKTFVGTSQIPLFLTTS